MADRASGCRDGSRGRKQAAEPAGDLIGVGPLIMQRTGGEKLPKSASAMPNAMLAVVRAATCPRLVYVSVAAQLRGVTANLQGNGPTFKTRTIMDFFEFLTAQSIFDHISHLTPLCRLPAGGIQTSNPLPIGNGVRRSYRGCPSPWLPASLAERHLLT